MRLFLSNTYSNPMILLMKYLLDSLLNKIRRKIRYFRQCSISFAHEVPICSKKSLKSTIFHHFPHVFFPTGAGLPGLHRAPRAPAPSAACQTPRGPGRAGDVRRAPRSRSRSSCEIQTNYLWKVFFLGYNNTYIYILRNCN